MSGWFKNLSSTRKVIVFAVASFIGLGTIGAFAGSPKTTQSPSLNPIVSPTPTPEPSSVQGESTTASPTQQPSGTSPTNIPPATVAESTPAPRAISDCDPNYSGGCVPIDSDVDCGGGSGNGPSYFYGAATVVGVDIYGLDRDGDGSACE